MNSFSAAIDNTSWSGRCAHIIQDLTNLSEGLVNQNGNPVPTWSDQVWGVTLSTCKKYCDSPAIPFPIFDIQTFAAGMTNYFLPWIALTAQLPFSSNSRSNNFTAFYLAVGSPALITYSLTLTLLNRYSVRNRFDRLYKKYCESETGAVAYRQHLRGVQALLEEAQQVPLRASQQDGWLSSLLAIEENGTWWERLGKSLKSTRRHASFSLVAPIIIAVVAWVLTIVSSYDGNPTSALNIAGGSLWSWLIPVIWGWILVGIQPHEAIETALSDRKAHRAQSAPGEGVELRDEQRGIIPSECGLTPQLHRHAVTSRGQFSTQNINTVVVPTWGHFGANIRGDERHPGPIFNYARIHTWWGLFDTVTSALEETLKNTSAQKAGRVNRWKSHNSCSHCGHTSVPFSPPHTSPAVPHEANESSPPPTPIQDVPSVYTPSEAAAAFCGLYKNHDTSVSIKAYPDEIHPEVRKHMFAAICIALLVQLGTTGSAIMIAYRTPVVGLGCRSGSFLGYGIAATVSFVLLIMSAELSHRVMVRLQHKQLGDVAKTVTVQKSGEMTPSELLSYWDQRVAAVRAYLGGTTTRLQNEQPMEMADRDPDSGIALEKSEEIDPTSGPGFWRLQGAAVVLRYSGKLVAFCSAGWLILSSLFELVGIYDNCNCNSSNQGWVLLFKTASDLKKVAGWSWGAGNIISFSACVMALGTLGMFL